MLEMLLETRAQWKAKQRLEREPITAEWERIAAKRHQQAGKRYECTERSTVCSRPNIYKTVNPTRF
jgi:hypothetical protein